jgi:flagellar protein FliJ
MADFTFRLTTVLRLREAARDERRLELAESQRSEQSLRQQLDELQAEWNRLMSAAREAVRPGLVAIDRLADAQRYRQALESRRQRLDAQRAELAAEIERRREALLKADRDVRMLERLRDAQRLRHRQETHRQEIKSLDEATQLRVAAGGRSSTTNLSSTLNIAGSDYHG